MSNIQKLEHPVVKSLIFKLRDKSTPPNLFRETLSVLAKILLLEALKHEEVVAERVESPLENTIYQRLKEEDFVIVAVLRAGLPMLEGCLELLPMAMSGFLGIKRDENTLESKVYYRRVPEVEGKTVILVDPMVATSGSISLAIDSIKEGNPRKIKSLHVIASPERLKKLDKYPDVEFFVGEIDRGLSSRGYIIPGIGDAGDRAFNTKD